MSFYDNIQNNSMLTPKHQYPQDLHAEVHKHSRGDHFPESQQLRLVPLNLFDVHRVKPQTQLQTTLFQTGNIVDYYLNSGYTSRIWLELEFNVINAPVTLNMEFLIDHIDIESDGQKISVLYDYNFYHNWLWKSRELTERQSVNSNKNANVVAQSLAVGSYRKYIELNCFINNCQLKLDSIKSRLLFRIFFSSKGVTSGLNTNIQVQLADILCETQQLSGPMNSLQTQRIQSQMLKYRFLNPVKAASETIAMNGNSEYNIRLTSLSNLSAFLIFHVREISAAPDIFVKIKSFELLDANNRIVGIECSHEQSRIISESMPGWLATQNQNIYIIPFSFTALSREGNQAGGYNFSTKEQIKIRTDSNPTWTNGNYNVEIYSYDYNTLILEKGILSVYK